MWRLVPHVQNDIHMQACTFAPQLVLIFQEMQTSQLDVQVYNHHKIFLLTSYQTIHQSVSPSLSSVNLVSRSPRLIYSLNQI